MRQQISGLGVCGSGQFRAALGGPSQRFFDRKLVRTNRFVATKALVWKSSKASWYVMSQGVNFGAKKVFVSLCGTDPF